MMLRTFVFFSSRRRHTRYWRDWSSDVCSSDLVALSPSQETTADTLSRTPEPTCGEVTTGTPSEAFEQLSEEVRELREMADREERRVGKECRSRWSPYH